MDFQPTDLPIENQYPKLVRDNIPKIIKEKSGVEVETKILKSDSEFLQYLLKKLVEESYELEHSLETENMQEELADVFEVIYEILKLQGWALEDIVDVQKKKREKNGGFEKRILMLSK